MLTLKCPLPLTFNPSLALHIRIICCPYYFKEPFFMRESPTEKYRAWCHLKRTSRGLRTSDEVQVNRKKVCKSASQKPNAPHGFQQSTPPGKWTGLLTLVTPKVTIKLIC